MRAAVIVLALMCLPASILAQAPSPADFGDAPDPTYPSLFHTSSGLTGPYHLDVTKDWIGPPGASTTTIEGDALVPDGDLDDGNIGISRTVWFQGPTQWGYACMDLASSTFSPPGLFYVNVAADLNADGAWAPYLYDGVNGQDEWILQNALIYLPTSYGFRLAFSFYFPDLSADAHPIWMRATLTDVPLAGSVYPNGWDGSGPAGGFAVGETEDSFVSVQLEDVTGRVDGISNFKDKGAGSGSAPVQSGDPTTSPTAEGYLRGGVPDISQGTNECAPTSATNSVQWLAGQQGFTAPANTLDQLKKDMAPGYTSGTYPGISPSNFVPGKNRFTARNHLPIATTSGGSMNGAGTFDWMKQQLKNGADVEMRIQYPGDGGHWVTVVGYSVAADGTQRIYINDPLSPGPRTDSYVVKPDGTIVGYPYGTAKMSFAVAETRVVWGDSSNFDVKNYTGVTTNDFEVTLGGVTPGQVKKTYTGLLGYPNSSKSTTTGGTKVTWNGGSTSPNGKEHFGYTLASGVTPTSIQLSWTKDGVVVGTLPSVPHGFKISDHGGLVATVTNANATAQVAVQRSVAVLTSVVQLDDLNAQNGALASQLVLIDPQPIPLGPGETLEYEIPQLPAEVAAVVLAYGVRSDIADPDWDAYYYNEALLYLPQAFSSIGELKTVPDGTPVTLDTPAPVVESLGGPWIDSFFDVFMSMENKSSGLAVDTNGMMDIARGDMLLATGVMTTVAGMRILQADDIQVYSTGGSVPTPLGMSGKWLGGPGLIQSIGLDTTGLPVTVWGRVAGPVEIPPGYAPGYNHAYLVDDGSGTPVTLATHDMDLAPGTFVTATGVSSSWALSPLDPGFKTVLPHSDEDIIPLGAD